MKMKVLQLLTSIFNYSILTKAAFYSDQIEFDWKIANTSIWLSSSSYCDPLTYLNRTFLGHSTGFQPTFQFSDIDTDTHGFIGKMEEENALYVVYRGSSSITNWLDDIDAYMVDYPECEYCYVHEGFYYSQQSVIKGIINHIKYQVKETKFDKIVVTGHSLGGALALLTAIELINNNFENVKLITFGSPRVGNAEFANYASKLVDDRSRVTHYKDAAVHCPFHEDFTHISGEWYQDPIGLKLCNGFEDPTCSYQWYLTSIADHMMYLDVPIGCRFVSKEDEKLENENIEDTEKVYNTTALRLRN